MSRPLASPPRVRTCALSCALTRAEVDQIRMALRQAGYPSVSEGIRTILVGYVRHSAIRDLVADIADTGDLR